MSSPKLGHGEQRLIESKSVRFSRFDTKLLTEQAGIMLDYIMTAYITVWQKYLVCWILSVT